MKSFLYIHCGSVRDMRAFYSMVLGLEQIYFSEQERSVGYLVGQLQITMTEDPSVQMASGWANQLGWSGGTETRASWGFELPAPAFRRAVQAAVESGATTHSAAPSWVGYWSFPVRDPMGNTVEITNPYRATLSEDTDPVAT